MCVCMCLRLCVCVRVCVCVRGDKWRKLNVENTLLIDLGVGNADFFFLNKG